MTFLEKLLILAIAAQILLTFIVLLLMGRERVPRVASGEIPMADIAVNHDAWPLRARLVANSFNNQFQLPVLFYVAALLALWAGGVSWVEIILAWAFVIFRYAHAAIHVTTNHVPSRFAAYVAGLAVLALLWLWLIVRLLILSPSS